MKSSKPTRKTLDFNRKASFHSSDNSKNYPKVCPEKYSLSSQILMLPFPPHKLQPLQRYRFKENKSSRRRTNFISLQQRQTYNLQRGDAFRSCWIYSLERKRVVIDGKSVRKRTVILPTLHCLSFTREKTSIISGCISYRTRNMKVKADRWSCHRHGVGCALRGCLMKDRRRAE